MPRDIECRHEMILVDMIDAMIHFGWHEYFSITDTCWHNDKIIILSEF